jgi:hypothetical protein
MFFNQDCLCVTKKVLVEGITFEGFPCFLAEFIGGYIGSCELKMEDEHKEGESHCGKDINTYFYKNVHKKMFITSFAIFSAPYHLGFCTVTTIVSANNLMVKQERTPRKNKKNL